MEFAVNTKIDKKAGKATMTITCPFSEYGAYVKKATDIHAKEGDIPGFRKGKAPRPMVINHYGRDTINDFAVRFLACEAVLEALKKEKINATSKVHFVLPKVEADKPIEFTADIVIGSEGDEPELPWPEVGDAEEEEEGKSFKKIPPDYLRK